jgi:hypothetical protein
VARDVGTRAFRRELDDQQQRIVALEQSGGGGGQPPLFFEDIFGEESGTPAQLAIGKNLTLSTPEEGWMRIDADDQLNIIAQGTNEWDGLKALSFGSGLEVEDFSGEGFVNVKANPQLQVEDVGSVGQINLGPGLAMEDAGEGVIAIDATGQLQFADLNEAPAEYTLQESDAGKMVRVPMLGGAEGEEEVFEITIPKDADEDLPVGSRVGIMVYGGFGSGITRIVRGEGVVFVSLHETVESTSTFGAYIYLVKVGADEWLIEDRNGFAIT